ncbi:MAG: serine hydrolase [bacterium]
MLQYNSNTEKKLMEKIAKKYRKKFDFSICIINLASSEHEIFGYQINKFIYPASCYKIFIGAEVLRQIEQKTFSLITIITVKSPNDVDRDSRIFPNDSRPLLKTGDKVSVEYLLNLMLTRSDNTASNCLIDLVSREAITENIIHKYGWQGSEVTRKFLNRDKENPKFRFSDITMSCAKHLAEFFYLVEKNQMVSPWVSEKLSKLGEKPEKCEEKFYKQQFEKIFGKGGWLETNLWKYSFKSAIKSIFKKHWAVIRWHNDVFSAKSNSAHYICAIMSVSKSIFPWKKFPMLKVQKEILDFMENLN